MTRSPRYLELLRALAEGGVDFIVVGGVAAILEGAPITTLDLDVVYGRSPENLDRLLGVLRSLGARYRDPAGREIEPDLERLRTLRLSLLRTDLGPLDVLSILEDGSGYDDLLRATTLHAVGDLEVRVLNLRALVEIKEASRRDKDRAMLPVLRETLRMKGG